jgi:hypothetical protein
MRIALRYVTAPLLAAGAAVTIAAATASATDQSHPARTTDASTAGPDQGGVYCGQFCGADVPYGNDPGAAAAPLPYGVGASSPGPLSPVSIKLPIVDAGIPMSRHSSPTSNGATRGSGSSGVPTIEGTSDAVG